LKKFLLALLVAAACATPYKPFEGRPVLAAVKFEGNHSIHSGELMSKIVTAPTSGFFSKTARYYDADLFEIDEKRIERYYGMKGFFSAKVVKIEEQADDKGRVTLVVYIEEGKRTKVTAQKIDGVEALTPKEAHNIDDALLIHPGDDFDEESYEKSKDVLQQRLKERGFAQADVGGKVEVDPDTAAATITFICNTGKRFKFGKVTVSGNRRISSDEITFATGITRGERYSPSAMALAQQRIYNLGTFSGVRVGLEPLSDDPVAGVRVNVREAPFQTFKIGFGASAEEQRWELPRIHGEYANRSLLGGLRRLELSSTIGYAFVNSPFDYSPTQSGITSENSAILTIPNIITPGLDWVSRGEFDREVQGGYAYDEIAGRTGLLFRYQKHTVTASLNLVRYFLVDLRTDLFSIISNAGAGAAILNDCPSSCVVTYPEIRYTFDGRDSAIEPKRGFYGTLDLQQTIKPGSFDYVRINPEVRYYFGVTRYLTVALRAEYGALIPESSNQASPFTQRFAFGGQNDQRGYDALQQSPKLGAAPICVEAPFPCPHPYASETVSLGGRTALLFSAELRFHTDFILNHLGIVPFMDASRVSNDVWRNPLEHGPLEVAPGLGLRYITPFGPIRLDAAWIVNPQDQYTQEVDGKASNGSTVVLVEPTRISHNCNSGDHSCVHVSRWAWHISLGEAF
jgi:translocation and assembly module TamA